MTWRYILAALLPLVLWAVAHVIITVDAARQARAVEDERRRIG